ncbi:MAG: DUF493 domain-containing protein [Chlorobi bacterium]|nr:DUF493 domain-containing protein [Chlorobiota bacterium]
MDEKYYKLRQILGRNKKWPLKYMFKFIVPNSDGKVDKVIAVFPGNAEKTFKYTNNLKYVSVTCVMNMESADDIIKITEDAMSVEGVMML